MTCLDCASYKKRPPKEQTSDEFILADCVCPEMLGASVIISKTDPTDMSIIRNITTQDSTRKVFMVQDHDHCEFGSIKQKKTRK